MRDTNSCRATAITPSSSCAATGHPPVAHRPSELSRYRQTNRHIRRAYRLGHGRCLLARRHPRPHRLRGPHGAALACLQDHSGPDQHCLGKRAAVPNSRAAGSILSGHAIATPMLHAQPLALYRSWPALCHRRQPALWPAGGNLGRATADRLGSPGRVVRPLKQNVYQAAAKIFWSSQCICYRDTHCETLADCAKTSCRNCN